MAVVAVYTHENCPGIPVGARVEVRDDHLDPDQEAAWARARAVAASIYWKHKRAEMARKDGNLNG